MSVVCKVAVDTVLTQQCYTRNFGGDGELKKNMYFSARKTGKGIRSTCSRTCNWNNWNNQSHPNPTMRVRKLVFLRNGGQTIVISEC